MTWDADTAARAEAIIARYPERRSAVMPLLYLAMARDGRLTDNGMRQVAMLAGMTPAQVHSVASFYSMYKREVGDHVVSVCRSVSCHLLGAEDLLAAVVDESGVRPGETGEITVEAVECVGACGGAPAVQVDYELLEGVTPARARALCRWLIDTHPRVVMGDEMQERFGGRRSFDWGPAEKVGAVGPVPAFEPYGTTGGGA
ncbi:MAG: NAD(P)H-dependent oxidoreductase subunit E [Actinomycetota bacterium]